MSKSTNIFDFGFWRYILKTWSERLGKHYQRHLLLKKYYPIDHRLGGLIKRDDLAINNYSILQMRGKVIIGRNCTLKDAGNTANTANKAIQLGFRSGLGRGIEISVWDGNTVRIGDYTTVNDYCKILGNVTIENFGVLSGHIYMSSGNHSAFHQPEMLIRDQDKIANIPDAPIHIEEDVWIGWGAFIRSGVTIGRGAVIGAYAAVTKDVAPYSVVVGQPAKELKTRLEFAPPAAINAKTEAHRPYFYRGFWHLQADLQASLQVGTIRASDHTLVVLQKAGAGVLNLQGVITDDRSLQLEVLRNGKSVGELEMTTGEFDVSLNCEAVAPAGSVPANLQAFDVFEFRVKGFESDQTPRKPVSRYGFSSVSFA